jgi:serine protease Do
MSNTTPFQMELLTMKSIGEFSRKSTIALLSAAFLASTAVIGSIAISPPLEVHAQQAQVIDPSMGFSQLVDQVMPAVVSVQVRVQNASNDSSRIPGADQIPPHFREFFENFPQFRDRFGNRENNRPSFSQGSGFVISADGYVVTNNHVVENASEVKLIFSDEQEYTAKVVGTDPKTDLALLKMDAEKSFPFVTLSAEEPKVGDWVMAVGNPFGLGGTVTSGIISARNRDIGNGPYDDYLQIDASINRGNSGGPAFNLKGDVVGVNTAIFSPSGGSVGIGFAIPASVVRDVVDSLKQNGAVTRGWLGVRIQPVTAELAEGLGMKTAMGAIISELTDGSPALTAGLRQGDTILKVDGDDIKDARGLSRKVAKVAPGKTVDVTIIRDGKEEVVSVEIGKMPEDPSQLAAAPQPDPKASDVASLGLKLETAEDGAGLKVTEVVPNSPASERGISVGDVILEVAGTEVNTPADLNKALAGDKNKRVLMLVKSGDNQRFVALPKQAG